MANQVKKLLWLFLFLLIAVSLIPAQPCQAASAKVSLTSGSTEVTVGKSVYVSININSGTTFTNFEANLIYNQNILKYQGGASVITGGNGYLKISDMNHSQSDNSRKYVLKFKALKSGSCKISFDGDVMVYDESENALAVSSNDLAIKVNAKKTASTDAYLKSLKTSPADLSPAFDKNVYEYSINVNNQTENLIIDAVPEDDKATVTTAGNESLKEGENKVIVSVLAESGNIIEYIINVNREEAPDKAAVTGEATATPGAAQNTFKILESNGEQYAVYNGRYKLVDPDSNVKIPDGYVRKNMTIAGVTITVYVPADQTDREFVLIYAENSSGEDGFYQYDTVEKTLQRYTPAGVNSDQISRYKANLNKAAIIIAFLSVISIFLIFITVWLFRKLKGIKKDDWE